MEKRRDWSQLFLKSMSYVLVAVAASVLTLILWGERDSKLDQLERIIDRVFIGEYEAEKLQDAAAGAMVDALPDRWSSYLSKEEYAAYQETVKNAYVGIGITVVRREDGTGHDIQAVTPGGSAQEGGILPGDILTEINGQAVGDLTTGQVRSMIGTEPGKQVTVTVLRKGERLEFTLECRELRTQVASGTLLEDKTALIRINNFNAGCGDETVAAIEDMLKQGATALIFDVRNNPGGYVDEMIQVLDYLLPEGVLFREMDYRGNTAQKESDASCVELPMAVLVNGDSYSAAEFFAACLREKEWATVVGEQTCGKGYYQNTFVLSDGSAVNLSTGKYFTPNGVSLADAGGLTPDVPVTADKETAALIYAQLLPPGEDPQVQAAVQAVRETDG